MRLQSDPVPALYISLSATAANEATHIPEEFPYVPTLAAVELDESLSGFGVAGCRITLIIDLNRYTCVCTCTVHLIPSRKVT